MSYNASESVQDDQPLLKKMRMVHQTACDEFSKAQEELVSKIHQEVEKELDGLRESNSKMAEELRKGDAEKDGLRKEVDRLRAEKMKIRMVLRKLVGDDAPLHGSRPLLTGHTRKGVMAEGERKERIHQSAIERGRPTEMSSPSSRVRVKRSRSSSLTPRIEHANVRQGPISPSPSAARNLYPQRAEAGNPPERIPNAAITVLFDSPEEHRRDSKIRLVFCRICHKPVGACPPNYPIVPDSFRRSIDTHCTAHPGLLDIIYGSTTSNLEALQSALEEGSEPEKLRISGTQSQFVYFLSNNRTRYYPRDPDSH